MITLSSIFKPYTDAIKNIIAYKSIVVSDNNISTKDLIVQFEKDKEIIKSSFDNDIIDLNEYVEQLNIINSKIKQLKVKQNYSDGIIYNEKGEILILRRSIDDAFYPDCWSLPGGKIENGESTEQAIIREIKEETNLKVNNVTPLLEKKIDGGTIHYFRCDVGGLIEASIILENKEHLNWKFVNREERNKMNLILDLNQTLNEITGDVSEMTFDLFPAQLGYSVMSPYSNAEEQVANTSNVLSKDIFMLNLFYNGAIDNDEYVDYIEKSYKDSKTKLIKLEGKDKDGKQQVKWSTKLELQQLAKHAKSTPKTNLDNIIKEHPNHQIRQVAHQEIDRRKKEEEVQDKEKIGHESHQYHGKEFKYDKDQDAYIDEDGKKANKNKLHEYHESRSNDQKESLDKLTQDLDKSTKEKDSLHKRLISEFYRKIIKSRFPTIKTKEEAHKISLVKLDKMGLKEEHIDKIKLDKILNKKFKEKAPN
jgi:8-oxo-dGTP pyrophosphatase MutT (NUDIX family)